jgi:hypothetical protein
MSELKTKPANGTKTFLAVLGFAAVFAPSPLRAEPTVSAATTSAVAPAATKNTMTPAAATTTTTTTTTTTKKDTGVTAPAVTTGTSTGIGNVGGHVGVAVPLVTFQGYTSSGYAAPPLDKTRTLDEQFNLAFPIGITVKTSKKVAVDFEVIVSTKVHPAGSTQLTVDPGVIYDWGPVATGLRLAVPVGAEPLAIGLIPLVNRGITKIGGATWFVEAAFPLLYHASGAGAQPNGAVGTNSLVEFNVSLHTGFGF